MLLECLLLAKATEAAAGVLEAEAEAEQLGRVQFRLVSTPTEQQQCRCVFPKQDDKRAVRRKKTLTTSQTDVSLVLVSLLL